ncbi:SDR family NAD(P)-dependent oxidoreductase [Streptomyces sp. TG1A-60]|uniref:SDR family NAD(P)-dependent oxidoreductase n=1 Tax=Streptomyces sp. TG1A-60 TaxID=3129111 RepID=UPI0030CE9197
MDVPDRPGHRSAADAVISGILTGPGVPRLRESPYRPRPVGSPAGQRASFGRTAYSASKGAIVAMTRTWALELAKTDVTVNPIVPTALTRTVATMPRVGDLVARSTRGSPLPDAVRWDSGPSRKGRTSCPGYVIRPYFRGSSPGSLSRRAPLGHHPKTSRPQWRDRREHGDG